jgi:hypothetical protein
VLSNLQDISINWRCDRFAPVGAKVVLKGDMKRSLEKRLNAVAQQIQIIDYTRFGDADPQIVLLVVENLFLGFFILNIE